MSRSGYNEDWGDEEHQGTQNLWRASVWRALNGKRGQAFLREMLSAFDAMPDKRLIANELVVPAPDFIPPQDARPLVCAIGSVGVARGVDMSKLDAHDYYAIAESFGVARAFVQEVEYENDQANPYLTPEQRWQRMRDWVVRQLRSAP